MPKDPNELWKAHQDGFKDDMRALMAAARARREELEAERTARADEALAASGGLLDDPNILQHVKDHIIGSGYAGDTSAPMIVYIALTSRFLGRPLNVGIVAASASGKNAAIDAALPLVPESAYVLVKASSPRALVYGEDDFEHRIVIVGEIDSIPTEDGPASSAVRSIATDNCMNYDVVEPDQGTHKWRVRRIVKVGPTGLITTSTRPLTEQLSTRMLTIGIPDSAEHTRRVLHAHADAVNGGVQTESAAQLVAAQRWLEVVGARDVFIPYAHALADAVPADLIRMRRDFRQLLTAIEAVAFLRQRQRTRDELGRIIATLDDYSVARELLLDVFTAAATGGVSKAVREVVTVVQVLGPGAPDGVTCATVAARVVPPLHPNTAWYRIRTALKLGLLVNAETRKGHPAKLKVGDPLPNEREALPTVQQISALLVSSPPESTSTVESAAGDPQGTSPSAVQAEVQGGLESLVEPLAEPPVLDAALAIQRFNSERQEERPDSDEGMRIARPTRRVHGIRISRCTALLSRSSVSTRTRLWTKWRLANSTEKGQEHAARLTDDPKQLPESQRPDGR